MEGFGLVLGGGGAKGGYEIGVWKALKELEIPVEVIAGTSVGALNGAIMVQGDYDAAYKLWTSISVQDVIKVEKEIAAVNGNNRATSDIISTIRNALTSGGLDVTPLKQMLQQVIDEKRIRESCIDLGIVTFSLKDFKPVKLFKKDIPEGRMVDYLLASACFPAFKPQAIGSKTFIDGGVYDNIPVSLMLERKVKDIIVVDISGPGVVRKVPSRGLNIIYIKNSEYLGGVLDFDGVQSTRNIQIGYYDALRAFKKLKGKKYYIIPPADSRSTGDSYIKGINIDDFKNMYRFLGLDWGSRSSKSNEFIIDKVMRTIRQYTDDKLSLSTMLPAMAEITAEQIGIERVCPYTLDELIDRILKEHESIKIQSDFNEYIKNLKELIQSRSQREFNRELRKAIIEGKFLIYYNPDINEEDEGVKRFRRFIAMTFPRISIANMFISIVLSRRGEKAT